MLPAKHDCCINTFREFFSGAIVFATSKTTDETFAGITNSDGEYCICVPADDTYDVQCFCCSEDCCDPTECVCACNGNGDNGNHDSGNHGE